MHEKQKTFIVSTAVQSSSARWGFPGGDSLLLDAGTWRLVVAACLTTCLLFSSSMLPYAGGVEGLYKGLGLGFRVPQLT